MIVIMDMRVAGRRWLMIPGFQCIREIIETPSVFSSLWWPSAIGGSSREELWDLIWQLDVLCHQILDMSSEDIRFPCKGGVLGLWPVHSIPGPSSGALSAFPSSWLVMSNGGWCFPRFTRLMQLLLWSCWNFRMWLDLLSSFPTVGSWKLYTSLIFFLLHNFGMPLS